MSDRTKIYPVENKPLTEREYKRLKSAFDWLTDNLGYKFSPDDKLILKFCVQLGIPPLSQWCPLGHSRDILTCDGKQSFVITGFNFPNQPKEHGYAMSAVDVPLLNKYVRKFKDPLGPIKQVLFAIMLIHGHSEKFIKDHWHTIKPFNFIETN